jgi:LmbE family N-acetylglucosaminyl deacetylase
MKVLVVAPHPDDDVIGCGGAIIQHINDNDQVQIIYVTSGESGSLAILKEELAMQREEEAAAAAQKMGVTQTFFWRWADGYVEYGQEQLIQVINFIREHQPDLVYLPHLQDGHIDHQVTTKVFLEGIGRAGGVCFQECLPTPWKVKTILGYEVWTPIQSPQMNLDISDEMEQKMRALSLHKSQLQNVAYDDGVRGLNRYRGAMSQVGQYVESFQVLQTSHPLYF